MYGFAEQVVRSAQTGQWLNKGAALDILRRFRADDPDVSWRQVWLLVVFSLWHQIYVERVYDPVALGWESLQGARPPDDEPPMTSQGTSPVTTPGSASSWRSSTTPTTSPTAWTRSPPSRPPTWK